MKAAGKWERRGNPPLSPVQTNPTQHKQSPWPLTTVD